MRAFLAVLLAIGLSSCSHESSAPATTADDSGTPAPTARSTSTTQAEAPGTIPGSTGATDLSTAAKSQEGADTPTNTDSSESSLERIASLPAAGQLPTGTWVAGKNYAVLSPAQPTDVAAGKVEVIEMFWYACPHCYALEPTVETWRKNKPAYIEFRRVPVTWNEEHRAHARLFYTLQALGKLDQLHGKVFDTIHNNEDLLFVPSDEKGTLQKQEAFAKANGISQSDFDSAYNSMNVQLKVQQADDLVHRERIDSVPTFVIAGKYVTDVSMAGDPAKLMREINDLASSEPHH